MSRKRRQHSPSLKAQVGLEALKNIDPVHAIAAKHGVHPTQVHQWKKEVAERLPEVFTKQADAEALAAKEREQRSSTPRSANSRCSSSGSKKVGPLGD
jgi:transposase-like protein